MNFRIGFGYDVHRLEENIPFRLGGVTVPHSKGAVGHSDADTLIHAICDALLGAAALGDIGMHFPNSDEAYRGIDSTQLLKKTVLLVNGKGYRIGNIDCTICLEKPKIQPFIPRMRAVLSSCLAIPVDNVSVKATTEEKLGFTGREEGVAAYAGALISKD